MRAVNSAEEPGKASTFRALDDPLTRPGDRAINHFRVGDRVRVARLGEFGTVWQVTIAAITPSPSENASTFAVLPGLALQGNDALLVWFDRHDQALADRQRRYVYFGDVRNKLTPDVGDDVEGFSYS